MLRAEREAAPPRKQLLTATRINRLQRSEHGYIGSESTIRKLVRQVRGEPRARPNRRGGLRAKGAQRVTQGIAQRVFGLDKLAEAAERGARTRREPNSGLAGKNAGTG